MTKEEAVVQLECLRDSAEIFEEFAENCEALQMAIDALRSPTLNIELIGEPIYRYRILRKTSEECLRLGFRKEYTWLAGNKDELRRNISSGCDVTIEERVCSKYTIPMIGSVAFLSHKEAEDNLKKYRRLYEQTD